MSGLSRDDIIGMVAEVGFHAMHGSKGELYALSYQHMEKFAALVAAAEREACASIEVNVITPVRDYTDMSPLDAYEAALMDAAVAFRAAIRARGQE